MGDKEPMTCTNHVINANRVYVYEIVDGEIVAEKVVRVLK